MIYLFYMFLLFVFFYFLIKDIRYDLFICWGFTSLCSISFSVRIKPKNKMRKKTSDDAVQSCVVFTYERGCVPARN